MERKPTAWMAVIMFNDRTQRRCACVSETGEVDRRAERDDHARAAGLWPISLTRLSAIGMRLAG